MSCSWEFHSVVCLRIIVIAELSKDSFTVGIHQQVSAVHTEVHNAQRHSSYSLSTETLTHLAVSDSIFLNTFGCVLVL